MWRVLLTLLLFLPAAAQAETKPAVVPAAPPAVIAMIDVQRILQESLAAKSVQKQLEAQRAKFQSEISGQEAQLHSADEKLKEARASLSAAELADREQQLRQKFTDVERNVQGKRQALDEAFATSMGVVRTNVLDTVQDIARQRGINLVLLKQQALWHDPAMDITSEVLDKLNARLTNVPVKIEIPPPSAGADAEKNKKN